MAKKKVKEFIIKVVCSKCGTVLYKYRKEGPGSLVKCYVEGILKDYTKGDLKCSKCGQEFARLARYHNRPAHKIIQGRVIIKGNCGK
jgi:DNA-directed RNA polymerase subunit M/transcription elongation factor TFIIS